MQLFYFLILDNNCCFISITSRYNIIHFNIIDLCYYLIQYHNLTSLFYFDSQSYVIIIILFTIFVTYKQKGVFIHNICYVQTKMRIYPQYLLSINKNAFLFTNHQLMKRQLSNRKLLEINEADPSFAYKNNISFAS